MKLPRWLRWRSSQELDEEIAAHLDAETSAGVDRGLTPDEARYAALRRIGNVTRVRERARQADPFCWLESIAKDLRYALRSLARHRSFTIAAVLSLGLGIGANSATFSFLDAIVLRPLPVPRPSEIVRIFDSSPRHPLNFLSYREYTALNDQNETLGPLTAERDDYLAVQGNRDDLPRFAYADFVSGNYFTALGVPAAFGRTFTAPEDTPAIRELPVVLSYQGWQAKFHSDPAIVGSPVRIDGQAATVIGVLPENFDGTLRGAQPEMYLPLHALTRIDPAGTILTDPLNRSLSVLGRLHPGSKLASVQTEFTHLAGALQRGYPDSQRERSFAVLTDLNARFRLSPGYAAGTIAMLLMAFIILWIACINVGNLLLGRAGGRAKEIALRLSVGASRRRVIAQLLTESVLLAALGAGAGVLLGTWAAHLLASIKLPSDMPISISARMDERALVYSLAAMIVSVLLFGLAPAFRATKVDLVSPVKDLGGRGPRRALISLQAALSVLTLVLGGLFAKNALNAARVSPGYRTGNVLLMTFDPSMTGSGQARTEAFYQQLRERVEALPGVRRAALGSHVQLSESYDAAVFYRDGENLGDIGFNKIEPGFFETLATPVIRGREIDVRDTEKSPRIAIVNETLAKRFFPRGDALGRRIRMDSATSPEMQIVGIARDAKYNDLSESPAPYVYLPFAQNFQPRMTLFVLTAGDPVSLAAPIRQQVKTIAPDSVVFDVRSMQSVFQGFGLAKLRLTAQLSGTLAVMGLILTVVGLYAVMAFSVVRKARELGIRMALGASRGAVLRQVLRTGLVSALIGIVAGLGISFAATYSLPLFSHVSPRDPEVFVGVPLLLLLVALAACWVPARRAARIDPAVTLKYE